MLLQMRKERHLTVLLAEPSSTEQVQVIIDQEKDVRITDFKKVVKIRFSHGKIQDVLVDDIFVWNESFRALQKES